MGLIITGCASTKATHGVPNFGVVDAAKNIYRGGQPTDEGWKWLAAQGVKRSVKLNMEWEGSDAGAESNGIEVVHVNIEAASGFWHAEDKPTMAKINAALDEICKGDSFAHCTHGMDRTGLVIGTYRVVYDHWTKSEAWAEMLKYDFHPVFLGLMAFWLEDVK